VEFDVEGLYRMDSETKVNIATKGILGGLFAPNEPRKKYFSLRGVKGGESVYLQQQNWALEDLAARRLMGLQPKLPTAPTAPDQPASDPTGEEAVKVMRRILRKTLWAEDEAA
jgi:hypothetical protein